MGNATNGSKGVREVQCSQHDPEGNEGKNPDICGLPTWRLYIYRVHRARKRKHGESSEVDYAKNKPTWVGPGTVVHGARWSEPLGESLG